VDSSQAKRWLLVWLHVFLMGREQFSLIWKGILKVARAIADLDGAGGVKRFQLAEALAYRRMEPNPAQAILKPSFDRP
jgi:predicted ATPase with chaperone activity